MTMIIIMSKSQLAALDESGAAEGGNWTGGRGMDGMAGFAFLSPVNIMYAHDRRSDKGES